MAVFPCSLGSHRYPGKQRSLYVSDVASARPETRKHRLCQSHFDKLLNEVRISFDEVSEGSQMYLMCQVCGEARTSSLFVKAYGEDGEEPGQWAIDVCGVHASEWRERLGWREMLPVGA